MITDTCILNLQVAHDNSLLNQYYQVVQLLYAEEFYLTIKQRYRLATSSMPYVCDTRLHTYHIATLKSAMKCMHTHGHACTLVHTHEDPCTHMETLAYTCIHAYQFEAYMCDITMHITIAL